MRPFLGAFALLATTCRYVRGEGCMILAGVAMPGGRLSPLSVVHATTGLSDFDGRGGAGGVGRPRGHMGKLHGTSKTGTPEGVL